MISAGVPPPGARGRPPSSPARFPPSFDAVDAADETAPLWVPSGDTRVGHFEVVPDSRCRYFHSVRPCVETVSLAECITDESRSRSGLISVARAERVV